MLGEYCEHKITGIKGKIINELSKGNDYPPQWGIYWTQGQKHNHYYWNDKDQIILTQQTKTNKE